MRVLLIAVLLSASLCAALPVRFRSLDPACDSGTCLTGECKGVQIKGQCPGSSVCCVASDLVAKCTAKGGKCDDKKNGCAGTWTPGFCPGKYTCCVPGQGQQQQAPSQTPAAPAGGAKLLCMSFDDGPFDDVSFRLAKAMGTEGVPSTFYVNCHKEMNAARRKEWIGLLNQYGHSIGNHMCEHDIMAQSHYTAKYNSYMRKSEGCLTTPVQQAVFRTHVQDNLDLWKASGYVMKTARLNGDGRFNPCIVKYVENPQGDYPDNPSSKAAFAGITPMKHVGWEFEIGPTMAANQPTPKPVMGHIKVNTGVTHNGHTLFATDTAIPSRKPTIILAHDLHYKDGDKVALLVKWVQQVKAQGFKWGKINEQGQCVPQ